MIIGIKHISQICANVATTVLKESKQKIAPIIYVSKKLGQIFVIVLLLSIFSPLTGLVHGIMLQNLCRYRLLF